ncbi:uncharacterized protein [Nicotiana tomentosiformis]|uniref:uncharacterized protein n=1 Tax=Nicotiana tomentosiformis TaxID=4098 RepID=UPI00388CA12C
MAGDDDDVDFAAREAAQLREKTTRDVEEATLREAQIAYEEERARRMAQNQLVGADQFRNIAPDQGRSLGDYARPVYNQGLSIYLRAFPFTLKDDAKHWLRSLPQGSIRTWEQMTRKFITKYFSATKTGKFRREIHNFHQSETETMFESWERFKEIMRKCQHSGIELWMQLQDFWDGFTLTSRRTLSNTVGGPLMKKTPDEIITILDELSEDANQWPSEIAERRRSTGVHQVDANTTLHVQLDAMAKEITKLTLASIHNKPHVACDICGRGHPTHECQSSTEEVNAMGNYNFNAMAEAAVSASMANSVWVRRSNEVIIVKTDERIDAHGSAINELWTGLRNLERQVGQIATILSERIPGTLPADTERNPKEMVNAVTLRSKQVLKGPALVQKEVVPEKEVEEHLKNEDDKKKKGKKGDEKKKKEETSRREESNESEHMPALPFPQKLYREKLNKQFERFLELLRQVNVSLPFIEVLSQMPAYAKFLKEILTKKRKIEETSVVKLTLENEIGEIRSAPISLQLADQTTIIPEGIVEDVLVREDKFVFLVDFIVLKMEENKEIPLILGRPFLATGRAILDLHDRKLMLRVGEETVTFEMNVETGVIKEKTAASVEWKVKGSKEKAAVKEKCGVYPKKAEKKLSA